MADAVIIKSYKNGFRLLLDQTTEFEELLKEIGQKFFDGKQFFGKSSVVLALEGRDLSEAEEIRILETIQMNCYLNIVCLVGHDEERDRTYIKAMQHMDTVMKEKDTSHFYKGSLQNNQKLTFHDSVVIFGDVNPGCVVKSGGSIIILGGLYGTAYAGEAEDGTCQSQDKHVVVALEFEPEEVKIQGIPFIPAEKSKWGMRQKIAPKIASVQNETVVLGNLNKATLESIYAL